MSEKVKFGTHEFDLVPMGISVDNLNKTRSIRFMTDLSYPDAYNIISAPENFETIQTIGNDGNPESTYVDCVAFAGFEVKKNVIIDENTTVDVYTVTYSINALERQLRDAQDKNKELEEKLSVMDGALWDLLLQYIPNIPMN